VYHHASQKVEMLEVTDPYSRGLAADGARSMFVDLDDDSSLMPDAWRDHTTPAYTCTALLCFLILSFVACLTSTEKFMFYTCCKAISSCKVVCMHDG
jgi:hypothetical protein